MENTSELDNEYRRKQLYNKLTDIAMRYNRVRNGVPAFAAIASMLLDPCERKIEYDLANVLPWETRFDVIFKELHSFVVARVLDHVRTRFQQEGLQVRLASEAAVQLGHFDILLKSGTPCRILAQGREVLKIEVKTAQSLPLVEATRYLWAGDAPLLIARFLTGQVSVFRPERLQEFISFTMSQAILKAERVLSGDIQALQEGPYE